MADVANRISGIYIITRSSESKGIMVVGCASFMTHSKVSNKQPVTFAITMRPRSEQNTYVAELEAMATAIQGVPPYLLSREITIFTGN